MKRLISLLPLIPLAMPALAGAETFYYRGTETRVIGVDRTSTPVWTEVVVSPKKDSVTVNIFKRDSQNQNIMRSVSGEQVRQPNGNWIWKATGHNDPATVRFRGDRPEELTRTATLANGAKSTTTITFPSNGLVMQLESKTGANPGAFAYNIDAGLILKNQFDAAMKGMKVMPEEAKEELKTGPSFK